MSSSATRQNRPRSDVVQAWRDQLANQHGVALAHGVRRREPELLPHFGDYYQCLHALPRRWRRALKRRMRRSLAGVALLLALGQGSALAATITVDGTACTLADAITAANTDTATGGCPAGSGADTLALPINSTITLSTVNSTVGSLDSGLPLITSDITIEGNGTTIERSSVPGTPDFDIFHVNRTGDLTLNQATIRGGSTGIHVFRGALTLNECTISGNASTGVASNDNGSEGGTIKINNTTISDNGPGLYAGGVATDYCYDCPGTITISNSTISGNAGRLAGGLAAVSGTWILHRTLISGNSGTIKGDVYNGVFFKTVFTANDYNLFGDSSITNEDALYGFTPGPTDITATSDGTNPTALSDILDTTLRDNGGPTETLALVEGSPAIDASPDDAGCPNADQRGVPRPQGAACDIGAYEFQSAAAPVGGAVTGMISRTIKCKNRDTGQRVTVPLPDDGVWDCEAAGLVADRGDSIAQRAIGVADGTASVGGSAVGITARKARCENRSTGQRVNIRLQGENTWDCEAAGLRVRTGDKLLQGVIGVAE